MPCVVYFDGLSSFPSVTPPPLFSVSGRLCLRPAQDEETIPVELRNLPEYKQLLELKRLKKQTLRDIQDDKEGVRHVGYKVTTATRWQPISKPSKWLCQGPPDMCTPCGLMCVSDDDDTAACKAPISAVSDEAACCLSLNVAWGVFRTDTQQPGVKKKNPTKKQNPPKCRHRRSCCSSKDCRRTIRSYSSPLNRIIAVLTLIPKKTTI